MYDVSLFLTCGEQNARAAIDSGKYFWLQNYYFQLNIKKTIRSNNVSRNLNPWTPQIYALTKNHGLYLLYSLLPSLLAPIWHIFIVTLTSDSFW